MSFKELKAKRDARLSQNSTAESAITHEKDAKKSGNGLYSQLDGSRLEMKNTPTRGRGLWAIDSIKPGTE